MKLKYNHWEVGERLRQKRQLLEFSQEEIAEKINRSAKYYADIERGDCGMSIETLMAISSVLNMSIDYILFGKTSSDSELIRHTDETLAIMSFLDDAPESKRKYAMRMLKIFLAACNPDFKE